MSSETLSPELHYNVYMPDTSLAVCYPLCLAEDAKVVDLENAVRASDWWGHKVKGETISLFKYGESEKPKKTRFDRVLDWLRQNSEGEGVQMQPSHRLQKYFPSGPAPEVDEKIDIIIATRSILGEPVASVPSKRVKLEDSASGLGTRTSPSAEGAALKFSEHSSDTFRHQAILEHDWVPDPNKEWQKFYDYWLKQDYNVEFRKDLITLVPDDKGSDDQEHRLDSIPRSCNRLYVRHWYRRLVMNICDLKEAWKRKGVILSGPPGTGKTTWLWFMLICCIMKKGNVLFHYKGETRLFFEKKLYKTSQYRPSNRWIKEKDTCIWSLIDSDDMAGPPPVYLTDESLNLFPVQVSLPNKARYSIWKKERQAYLWGMPLWKHKELVEALKLHKDYNVFMDVLRRRLATLASGGGQTGDCAPLFPADGGQTGASSPLMPPPHMPQDDKRDDNGDEEMIIVPDRKWDAFLENAIRLAKDNTGHWNDAETVFELMVKDAVYQFGEAVRDVTEAVTHGYESLNSRVTAALGKCDTNFDQVLNALGAIGTEESMTSKGAASYQLFALELHMDNVMKMWDDQFIPKFKSDPIGKRVMEKVGHLAIMQARKFLGVFEFFPESSSLAHWIFESIANQNLSAGYVPISIHCMELDDTTKEIARAVYECLPEEIQSTRFPVREREYVTVTFENDELMWDENEPIENLLCVPRTANSPFFDSFFVDMDVTKEFVKATIWIVQATISKSHDGSKGCFPLIKSVKNLVEKQAEKLRSKPHQTRRVGKSSKSKRSSRKRVVSVDLKYLLICPKPITPRKWNFPRGVLQSELQGDVFCMHVEVATPASMYYRFLSPSISPSL